MQQLEFNDDSTIASSVAASNENRRSAVNCQRICTKWTLLIVKSSSIGSITATLRKMKMRNTVTSLANSKWACLCRHFPHPKMAMPSQKTLLLSLHPLQQQSIQPLN